MPDPVLFVVVATLVSTTAVLAWLLYTERRQNKAVLKEARLYRGIVWRIVEELNTDRPLYSPLVSILWTKDMQEHFGKFGDEWLTRLVGRCTRPADASHLVSIVYASNPKHPSIERLLTEMIERATENWQFEGIADLLQETNPVGGAANHPLADRFRARLRDVREKSRYEEVATSP